MGRVPVSYVNFYNENPATHACIEGTPESKMSFGDDP